jgi:hypothetical protein
LSETPDKSKKRFDGIRAPLPDEPKKRITVDEIRGALPPDPNVPRKPAVKKTTQS